MNTKPYISVVAPLYNEEGNAKLLHEKIVEACRELGKPFEVIFVDDGSSDKTLEECESLSPLKLVVFRRNFGQTAAFDAGIKAAEGEIIITMDGDLQNDPKDIPLFLAKLDEGYDAVSGWRWQRKDPFMKRFVSRGADKLRKILLKDSIHDSGIGFKAYKRETLKNIDLYGEMHRFIPAILEIRGFKVGEVKVTHHPRIHGVTKYNWRRIIKSFVDMLSLWFWERYAARPMHFLGGVGIVFGFIGTGLILWMIIEKLFFGTSLSEKIWPMVGIFFVLIGVQFFIFGLLADIVMKNYYRQHKMMNYSIREVKEL